MYRIITYYYEDKEKIADLYSDSKRLWREHACFTRNAIISLLAGSQDITAVSNRLMKNQEDISFLLYPYHNDEEVNEFAKVLKEHVTLAVSLVKAVVASEDLTEPSKAWYDNGDVLLEWMEDKNPHYWSRVITKPLWNDHLKYTVDEVNSRLKEDWEGDINAFDHNQQCIDKWAELFATGIVYNNMDLFAKQQLKC